ncbi:MAG: hypothetical protein AAB700_00970, partial [Patescibacteria group bacterium]
LLSWFFLEGCYTVVDIDSSSGYNNINRSGPGVNIEFSGGAKTIANLLGIGHKSNLFLANNTSYYITVCVLDEIFDINPNSAIFDFWNIEFYYSSLPIVVYVFSDENRKRLVKIENGIFPIGKSENAFWELDKDCRLKKLQSSIKLNFSRARKINVPTIKNESTTLVQFINTKASEVAISEAGPMRCDLARSGFSRENYTFVKNRKGKIGRFGYLSFSVYPSDRDQFQRVMYWIEGIKEPIIIDIQSNLDRGPRVIQFVIK